MKRKTLQWHINKERVVNPWLLVLYLFVSLIVFYVVNCLGILSGGGFSFKRIPWYLPGGLKRRTAFIKKMVGDTLSGRNCDGTFCGAGRSWDYGDIRDNNLYEEVAKNFLMGPFEFWLIYLVVPLFWPIAVPLFLLIRCF